MSSRKSAPKNMSDEDRLEKNKRIKKTLKATRERRSTMDCKVFQMKVSKTRINGQQGEALNRIFLEAKWVRNALIASGEFTRDNLKNFRDTVPVHTPDGVEMRDVRVLGGQIAQGVLSEIKTNLRQLSSSKKNGHKVGRLKFCQEITSIDFVQAGNSWKLNTDNSTVKLANIPGWIKVRGLKQIPEDAEFGNAKLVRRASGLYIHITTFIPKVAKDDVQPGTVIGVDMGIATGLTFSDGSKINVAFGESERLRRLRRKLNRQVKGSNKYNKTWELIKRELEKNTRRKNDAANKIVHELAKNERIFFQDENISAWKNKKSKARGSKKIHSGILGRVKSQLKTLDNAVCLDRFEPTTQLCVCGAKNKHTLDKRVYRCTCGYIEDRDIHAALNMIRIGRFLDQNNSTGLDRIRTPVEFSVRPAEMSFAGINVGTGTVKREAARSSASP